MKRFENDIIAALILFIATQPSSLTCAAETRSEARKNSAIYEKERGNSDSLFRIISLDPDFESNDEPKKIWDKHITKNAVANFAQKLSSASSENNNCVSSGAVEMQILTPPKHGIVKIKEEPIYPSFPQSNSHHKCNFTQILGNVAYYMTSQTAFGSDKVALREKFPNGEIGDETFDIVILDASVPTNQPYPQSPNEPWEVPLSKDDNNNSKPSINSKNDTLIFSSYSINPDCSSPGFSLLATVGKPAHGTVRVEPEKAYAVFPEGHPYFKCTGAELKKVRMFYKADEGYVGTDTVHVIGRLASGREFHSTVSIMIKD